MSHGYLRESLAKKEAAPPASRELCAAGARRTALRQFAGRAQTPRRRQS